MQNEGDFEDIALLEIISVTKVVMSQKHKIQVRRITLYLKQMICVTIRRQLFFFGLSKERPILGDHAKAHIHEIRRISCEIHLPTL